METDSDSDTSNPEDGQEASDPSVPPLVKRVVGPMLAALIVDAVDLLTFGPVGVATGFLVGGTVGYWLAPELGFSAKQRWTCAIMTGIYCTLPLTGLVPVAMIAAALSRLVLPAETPREVSGDRAMRPEGAIEAEYESKWEG